MYFRDLDYLVYTATFKSPYYPMYILSQTLSQVFNVYFLSNCCHLSQTTVSINDFSKRHSCPGNAARQVKPRQAIVLVLQVAEIDWNPQLQFFENKIFGASSGIRSADCCSHNHYWLGILVIVGKQLKMPLLSLCYKAAAFFPKPGPNFLLHSRILQKLILTVFASSFITFWWMNGGLEFSTP